MRLQPNRSTWQCIASICLFTVCTFALDTAAAGDETVMDLYRSQRNILQKLGDGLNVTVDDDQLSQFGIDASTLFHGPPRTSPVRVVSTFSQAELEVTTGVTINYES